MGTRGVVKVRHKYFTNYSRKPYVFDQRPISVKYPNQQVDTTVARFWFCVTGVHPKPDESVRYARLPVTPLFYPYLTAPLR